MNNPTIFSSAKAAVSATSSAASLLEASASSDAQSASNTIFAADELDSVFRIGSTNDSTQSQHGGLQARDSNSRRRRFISPSFATDGELSTFSDEDNDASDDSQENINSASAGIHLSFRQSSRRSIFYPSRRQQSPFSDIFRMPISGTKRHCEDMMTEDDDAKETTTTTTPLLSRANCICSSNDSSDDYSTSSSSEESLDQMMSSPSSKRMCISRNDSPSSYISLFSVTSPATIDYRGADSAIITPRKLEHPLASSRPLIES
ncbi:hypothetical protein ACHAWT_011147 [Skeletonema menzelii]|mmetsp:Transcript_4419/g.7276  ORF Transcript_4419/g.7276 Transcript_4419/m.7276 type:complete len:262 (-) Transcript_4419:55-840(-)|eukprot:scaffold4742_cov149-Skeletonema_menzelii.AAC.21